jgi:hypothetical protein
MDRETALGLVSLAPSGRLATVRNDSGSFVITRVQKS